MRSRWRHEEKAEPMAWIGVDTDCTETFEQLETLFIHTRHEVRMTDGQQKGTEADSRDRNIGATDLYVVDADCDPRQVADRIRSITECAATSLSLVLVAASGGSNGDLAVACAYGATGLLRKPFTTVETVPDTERALTAATPASR